MGCEVAGALGWRQMKSAIPGTVKAARPRPEDLMSPLRDSRQIGWTSNTRGLEVVIAGDGFAMTKHEAKRIWFDRPRLNVPAAGPPMYLR